MKLLIKFKDDVTAEYLEKLNFTWFDKNEVHIDEHFKEFTLIGDFYISLSNRGDKLWIENRDIVFAAIEFDKIKRFVCTDNN